MIGVILVNTGTRLEIIKNWEKAWLFFTATTFSVFWALNQMIPVKLGESDFDSSDHLALKSIIPGSVFGIIGGIAAFYAYHPFITNLEFFLWIVFGFSWGGSIFFENFFLVRGQNKNFIIIILITFLFWILSTFTNKNHSLTNMILILAIGSSIRFLTGLGMILINLNRELKSFNQVFFYICSGNKINSLNSIIKYLLPLSATYLLAGIVSYFDGWYMEKYFSATEFLQFRYGGRELPLNTIIASATSTGLVAILSFQLRSKNGFQEGFNAIKRKTQKLVLYLYPFTILLLLVSSYLFDLVYGNKVPEAYKIFDIFLLLIAGRFLFPQSILLALQKNKILLHVGIAETLLHISLTLILGNIWKGQGVALATVIAFLFEKLVYIYLLKKKLNINFSNCLPLKPYILFNLILISTYLLKQILKC